MTLVPNAYSCYPNVQENPEPSERDVALFDGLREAELLSGCGILKTDAVFLRLFAAGATLRASDSSWSSAVVSPP